MHCILMPSRARLTDRGTGEFAPKKTFHHITIGRILGRVTKVLDEESPREARDEITQIPANLVGAFCAFEDLEDAAFAVTGHPDVKFFSTYVRERMKIKAGARFCVKRLHKFVHDNKDRFLNMTVTSVAHNPKSRHQGSAMALKSKFASAGAHAILQGRVFDILDGIEEDTDV